MPKPPIRLKELVIAILIPELTGAVSGLITMNSMQEFAALNKPPFAAPGWLFGVVWPVLYLLMGIASYRVWRTGTRQAGRALLWYGLQLAVNFLWPIFFFSLQWWMFAFWWLLLLIVLVGITMAFFSTVDRPSFWLLTPYMAWLLYAGWLNMQIYRLN